MRAGPFSSPIISQVRATAFPDHYRRPHPYSKVCPWSKEGRALPPDLPNEDPQRRPVCLGPAPWSAYSGPRARTEPSNSSSEVLCKLGFWKHRMCSAFGVGKLEPPQHRLLPVGALLGGRVWQSTEPPTLPAAQLRTLSAASSKHQGEMPPSANQIRRRAPALASLLQTCAYAHRMGRQPARALRCPRGWPLPCRSPPAAPNKHTV